MRRVIAPLAIAVCVLLPSVGAALAGQPGTNAGVNCGTPGAMMTPGNSAMAPGSPFNSTTPGKAGQVYANAFNGSPPSPNAPLQATSQYDIACKNVSAHQPP
jgi:hypothetical protein